MSEKRCKESLSIGLRCSMEAPHSGHCSFIQASKDDMCGTSSAMKKYVVTGISDFVEQIKRDEFEAGRVLGYKQRAKSMPTESACVTLAVDALRDLLFECDGRRPSIETLNRAKSSLRVLDGIDRQRKLTDDQAAALESLREIGPAPDGLVGTKHACSCTNGCKSSTCDKL